jgi:DNA invertase Pin-like site-specific DNA recombinase
VGAKAYSYIRFSTKDQLKGDSFRRQSEKTAAWCKQNEVELVENYQDLGVSAYRGKNAETGDLSRFLKLVQAGRVPTGSYLVVENLDRLSRDSIFEAQELFTKLVRASIKVVTLSDGQIYDRETITKNPLQLIISITVLTRAHEESQIKSERLCAAWANKRNRIALGEKMSLLCPKWLRLSPDRRSYVPIPERVRLVERIFQLYRTGKGVRAIVNMLNRENVPPFVGPGGMKGEAWHPTTVMRLLKNRAVIGEFSPGMRRNNRVLATFDPVPDYFPAVLSKELFASVQQILKAHSFHRPRGRSGFNVFSRLAFDRNTGSVMLYRDQHRSKGYHYLIPSAAIYYKAKYESWNYDDFLNSFVWLCHVAALEKQTVDEKGTDGLALKREELAAVEKKITQVVEYLAEGRPNYPAIGAKLDSLHEEKRELERQIADAENAIAARPADLAEIDWDDREALRENLRAAVKRITVDCKKRWFKVEFLNGRAYTYREEDGKVVITSPDGQEQQFVPQAGVDFKFVPAKA